MKKIVLFIVVALMVCTSIGALADVGDMKQQVLKRRKTDLNAEYWRSSAKQVMNISYLQLPHSLLEATDTTADIKAYNASIRLIASELFVSLKNNGWKKISQEEAQEKVIPDMAFVRIGYNITTEYVFTELGWINIAIKNGNIRYTYVNKKFSEDPWKWTKDNIKLNVGMLTDFAK